MANAGMDIKTLQYVMEHSDVGVTLNVYTHASYDCAAEQMAKILDFKEADMRGKQRRDDISEYCEYRSISNFQKALKKAASMSDDN